MPYVSYTLQSGLRGPTGRYVGGIGGPKSRVCGFGQIALLLCLSVALLAHANLSKIRSTT